MQFPLSFWDISLAFAVVAVVLLLTSEFVSPHLGRTNLAIERKVLETTASVFTFAFLFTVLVRLYQIIFAS